jgi:methionyl-tRNA formyltransferase
VKSDEALERIRDARPDVLVVAAYGMILPQRLLDAPRLGALNIHASLLPRWRGAAPIQRALLAGDTETGISIMQMDAGLDTGPVLKRQSIEISPIDDGGTIHDRLAALGARMIVDTLSDLQAGRAHAEPQPAEGVTYAAKISKQDTVLDWRRPAVELERMVRAFRPAPGAVTSLDGEPLKIWRASVLDGQASPGSIAIEGGALVVGCSSGRLKIEELQKAGGRRMPAGEFVRGFTIRPGARLA